jgi:choline dehydrogenase
MYDYVVVGAGAAGCVIAGRLSDDPACTVLLVEAGPSDGLPEMEIPLAAGALIRSRYDWDFTSEAEPGLERRTATVPRGRVLGGTTVLNAAIYMRGIPADYDAWSEGGASGWSYDDVLPYFRLSEDNERGADRYHGVGGPLTVSDSRSRHPLCEVFLEASLQAGVPANDDFNGAVQEGVGYFQLMQRGGHRCSAAKAFLHPALGRPNLTVLTETQATRVVFEGRRAVGVETLRYGQVETHHAAAEVIMCAGAIQSPQLLLLSGIGPAEELRAFGISVIADLPVGRGLQDHMMVPIVYWTEQESLISAFTAENVERFEREGRGALTSNAAETGAFIRSSDDAEIADFELFGIAAAYLGPDVVTRHGVTIAGYPTKPVARGRVTLRSADPFSKPRILHDYLNNDVDRAVVRDGVRRILEIFAQPAYTSITTGVLAEPVSNSDADIDAFVRAHGACGYHHAGSCPMGGVLDAELRVQGVDALRVVDASSMPELIRGNPMGPTLMMAEKAVDLIRGTNRVQPAGGAAVLS